jgi:YVTN family beta-propeller protein
MARLLLILAAAGLFAPKVAAQSAAPAAAVQLDYEYFKQNVQPIFLAKRPGHARCVTCHSTGNPRLQALPEGATIWDEEQSRKNFDSWRRAVVPGNPNVSRLLTHPLAVEAGGDHFHAGGKHWTSKDDPEWQTLAAWVKGATLTTASHARVIQTNAAGDDVHVIDPATNTVVGVIHDIEVPHGVTLAPDGSKIYITDESLSTLDVVDAMSLQVTKRIPLSGHPNNLDASKDGKRVYVGIAQPPGAVDVIDVATLTNVKSIPVDGAVHNVYVTPDDKFAVSGSVASSVISVIDRATETVAWNLKMSSGIRPIVFTKNPDGSTKELIVQLSNFHGFAVVDFATHKEVKRVELPDLPGVERETEGLQGSPAHGLAITPDGKTLWATSKYYGYVAAYSLPDFTFVKTVKVGSHPEWLTIPPDGKDLYVAVAGQNATVVVDNQTMNVVATIPVGQVPKRNGSGMLKTQ